MKRTGTCEAPSCDRPILARGLCQTHYWQRRRGQELRPIRPKATKPRDPCTFADCGRLAYAKGLCVAHRKQQLRGHELTPITRGIRSECTVEDCEREAPLGGLCTTHTKYRAQGKELRRIEAPLHRYTHGASGYVLLKLPDHPNASKSGLVMEHIKVMTDVLGRPLIDGENVHHLNGQRDDNRPENLELWSTRQPKGQRVEDKIAWCIEFLGLYGYTVTAPEDRIA